MFTWDTRELPILRAIHGLEETLTRPVLLEDLDGGLEMDADTLQRGLRALFEGGYVTGKRLNGHGHYRIFYLQLIGLTSSARRAIGQWPSDSLDRLVEVIEDRIEATDDKDERKLLQRLRDALMDGGASLTLDVLKAWALEIFGPR